MQVWDSETFPFTVQVHAEDHDLPLGREFKESGVIKGEQQINVETDRF